MKIFYAVRYNDEWDWDYGSTRKREAIVMANKIKSKGIAIIDSDDSVCIGELKKEGGYWVESRKRIYIY